MQYIKWHESGPFDIENTCLRGINVLAEYQNQLKESAKKYLLMPEYYGKMFQKIYQSNQDSIANGSLMRIQPFAILLLMLNLNPLYYSQFIQSQIKPTHPNTLLVVASCYWVTNLTMLTNRKRNQRVILIHY